MYRTKRKESKVFALSLFSVCVHTLYVDFSSFSFFFHCLHYCYCWHALVHFFLFRFFISKRYSCCVLRCYFVCLRLLHLVVADVSIFVYFTCFILFLWYLFFSLLFAFLMLLVSFLYEWYAQREFIFIMSCLFTRLAKNKTHTTPNQFQYESKAKIFKQQHQMKSTQKEKELVKIAKYKHNTQQLTRCIRRRWRQRQQILIRM